MKTQKLNDMISDLLQIGTHVVHYMHKVFQYFLSILN